MTKQLPEGLTGEQVSKRMLWLAWQGCGMPLGMGWLQDKKEATEDDVWKCVARMDDYPERQRIPGFNKNKTMGAAGEFYADYVFGRMMKTSVRWAADSVTYDDVTPRGDYQGWASRYPTYDNLFDAAVASLQGQEPPKVPFMAAMQRTVNCVKCGKPAVSWSGHVVKEDGERVLAGSCRKCADAYYHAGMEEVLRTLATGGCMGSWQESHGLQEDTAFASSQ